MSDTETRPPRDDAGASEQGFADGRLSASILSAASTMVGVSVTVLGLLRVFGKVGTTRLDEALVLTSIGFLGATVCAYGALRTRTRHRARLFERLADSLFLVSLAMTVVICALISYEFI